ncbi:MAG: NAD(P)H-dependent oxidoreductase [Candidatus Rifleibacteriota bacterium]
MKKLLHIIASPRQANSRTSRISNYLVDELKANLPDLEVDELSLFAEELPEMNVTRVDGKYVLMSGQDLSGEAEKSWEMIRKHIDRFLAADIVVISTPMWNFSIPYKLKHYIDIIVQPRLTFRYGENGVEGLARGKKVIVVSSHGGDYSKSSPAASYDQLTPYLSQILGFIGITDLSFISAQPMDASGSEVREQRISEALDQVKRLVKKMQVKN